MSVFKRIILKGDTEPIHEPNAVASRLLLSKLSPLLKHFLCSARYIILSPMKTCI